MLCRKTGYRHRYTWKPQVRVILTTLAYQYISGHPLRAHGLQKRFNCTMAATRSLCLRTRPAGAPVWLPGNFSRGEKSKIITTITTRVFVCDLAWLSDYDGKNNNYGPSLCRWLVAVVYTNGAA